MSGVDDFELVLIGLVFLVGVGGFLYAALKD